MAEFDDLIEVLPQPVEPGIQASEILIGNLPVERENPESFTQKVIERLQSPEFQTDSSRIVLYRPHMAYMTDESAALMRQLCYLGVGVEDAYKSVFYLQNEVTPTPSLATTIDVPSLEDESTIESVNLIVTIPRFIDHIDPETAEVTRTQDGNRIIINPRIAQNLDTFFAPYEEKRQKMIAMPNHSYGGEDEQTYFYVCEIGEIQRNHPYTLGRIVISPLCYSQETIEEFERWEEFFKEHQMKLLETMGAMAVDWGTPEEQKAGREPIYIDDYDVAVRVNAKDSIDVRGHAKREGLTMALGIVPAAVEHYKQSIIALLRTTDMVAKNTTRNTVMLQQELKENGLSADTIYTIVAGDRYVANALQETMYGTVTVTDYGHIHNQAYGQAAHLAWDQTLNVTPYSDTELLELIESHPDFQKRRNSWEVLTLQAFIYIYYIMPNVHAPSERFPEDTEASIDVINAFCMMKYAEWEYRGLFQQILDANKRKRSVPVATIEILSAHELRGQKFDNPTDEINAFGREMTPRPELLPDYLQKIADNNKPTESTATLSPADVQRLLQQRRKKKKK